MKLWSTKSETQPSKNNLYEEDFDPVYPRKSLEQQVITQIANGFHHIVENVNTDLNSRHLDPFQMQTFTRNIKADKVDLTLNLEDPVLKGLDTNKLASAKVPEFFKNEGVPINLSLEFTELVLSPNSYDREDSFKLLFKDRHFQD